MNHRHTTAINAITPPAGAAPVKQPAGLTWDAVRVSLDSADDVLKQLGDQSGAVIEDPAEACRYWLVAPGAAEGWTLPHPVLRRGAFVPVPPARRTEGPTVHWRVPPGPTRGLTDALRLHAALVEATGGREDPVRAAWIPFIVHATNCPVCRRCPTACTTGLARWTHYREARATALLS
ncbi:hypothetical protein LRS74_31510 [Streptomyces sp. LX-29]|uniref:hypothetical protein n=1 Tax=Streptomyces sp. LX-29 TaxID=2900152 RepID=UPI00240D6B95|nr:hypothetical protein [Streptomyces sp. LX-29]WFB11065.1 hypothetical protein LRS74_31510 [Streptomyces sp. LX-29]